MSFLSRVAGHSLRDGVKYLVTQDKLSIEPLFLHSEGVARASLLNVSWTPPWKGIPGRDLRQTQGAGGTMSLGCLGSPLGLIIIIMD